MKGRGSLEKKVKEIIASTLDMDISKVKNSYFLAKDLGMDSFAAVELTYGLKDKFGIEIPQEDFKKIEKVEDVINYVLNFKNKR